MNKKKIVFLVHNFDIGGVQKQNLLLINGINKDKFDVHVLYLQEGTFMNDLDINHITMKKLGNRVKLMSPVNILYILKTIKYIRMNHIDVIHTIDPVLYVVGASAAHFTGIKHIRTQPNFIRSHERLNVKTLKLLPFERWTHKYITLQYGACKDLVAAGVSADKIETIYGYTDREAYLLSECTSDIREEFDIPKDHKIVLAMHRMVPMKGFETFIEMIPYILKAYKKVSFLLVGDGPLRNQLEARAEELGVIDHVRFTGFRKDIANIAMQTTFGVYPLGNTVAMIVVLQAGKVLITKGNSTMDEYIDDGRTGFLTPDDEPETYAEYALNLLNDEKLLSEMEKNQRELSESRFDGKKNLERFENVILSVCE